MRVSKVVLSDTYTFPGQSETAKKAFASNDTFDLFLHQGLVFLLRRGTATAVAFPVAKCAHIEFVAADVQALAPKAR